MGFYNYHRSSFKAHHRFKIKADANIKPEEYIAYFEDLIFGPNAEIGPVVGLETAT